MKNLFLVLLAMLLTLTLFSCKDGKDGGFLEDLDINYTNEDAMSISIDVPDDWDETHSSYYGADIRHYTSLLSGTNDKYAESIAVTCEEKAESDDLASYSSSAIDGISSFYADIEMISDKENIKLGELDAVKVVYSYSMGTYKLVNEQVFVIDGDKAYVILCTADSENYDEYKDIFEKAQKSFKIV